ncbi:unnamed protein product [Merluccius merluccius]
MRQQEARLACVSAGTGKGHQFDRGSLTSDGTRRSNRNAASAAAAQDSNNKTTTKMTHLQRIRLRRRSCKAEALAEDPVPILSRD